MAQSCQLCGKSPVSGNQIARRGLPKRTGGIGLKTTGINKRWFRPNLQKIHVLLEGRRCRVRVCVKCIRTGRIVKAPRNPLTAKGI
jgi:large subunit ribosomal protein L28